MTRYLDEHILFENIFEGKVGLRKEKIEAIRQQAENSCQFFGEKKAGN
ncbi:hypothetical protein [Cyclobacterium lianum]|nr:hypothetical protein [Cyclobacterium lianum]